MDVEFADDDLERLYYDPTFERGLAGSLVRAYRKVVGHIVAAPEERAIRAMKSFHFEKLKGQRSHQHSLRLNNQYRLIVELIGKGATRTVRVVAIEDYH